jgi:hypothetical protein
LYAFGEWWRLFVNLALTVSSAFLLLKDLRRNRLVGRLTQLQPAPTPDKYEEKYLRDAIGAPALQPLRLSASLNSRSQNIFNGLLRVPVKKKNPALNSI